MKIRTLVFAFISAAMIAASPAIARDNIQIKGSSTVLPYATIVAEAFGENFDFPTPVVEGGGSGAGRKALCEGIGPNTIDIADSSSKIKQSDIDACNANGVGGLLEVRIGYDGIVFASDINGPSFEFTPADWYNALAEKVVDKDGNLVDNPYTNWSQIRDGLPDQEILAFVPGTKHGTREVFDVKVLEQGCKDIGMDAIFDVIGVNPDDQCIKLRTDGRSIDIDGDYTETLQRLDTSPHAIGVFGLSFYLNNTNKLRVATMDGVTPSVDTIASGEYPVSRPLYFYVKLAHLDAIPGLREYINFFVSDDMAGPDGPLAEYGLVSDPELAKTQALVAAEAPYIEE